MQTHAVSFRSETESSESAATAGVSDHVCCVVFRFYGLSVWFPDVIKHLQADEYASRVKIHNNERIEDFTFNFTLENQIHRNGVFLNDR